MTAATSRYWFLVRLDGRGKRKVEEIKSAKTFFQAQFSQLTNELSSSEDYLIQRQLMALRQESTTNHQIAEICLRCCISSQIEQVCQYLENRFGSKHGFTCDDLFPFVLDDTLENRQRSTPGKYTPLSMKILQTFDQEKASLSTWTNRLVKNQGDLKAFLLEKDLYLVSDWAILNETTPKKLRRILAKFHLLGAEEIQQFSLLLESYHAIYLRDRLNSHQARTKGKCQPPSTEQLQAISRQGNFSLSPEKVLFRLQSLADRLRQYSISVRSGFYPQDSLENPNTRLRVEQEQIGQFNNDSEDETVEFLKHYRQQFLECLDRAIAAHTQARFNGLQQKNEKKAQQFLMALKLFHCQEKTMGEIALLIEMQSQCKVSRLVKLKEFRSDIQQQMLQDLSPVLLNLAQRYTNPEQLLKQSNQIETILNEEIANMMETAKKEASTVKNIASKSLFAQRICQYLNQEN